MNNGAVAKLKESGELRSEAAATFTESGGLQLLYETAPVGLAFLSTDCHYLMINQRLTEICGLSVADHVGRSVRETVPQVAEQIERVVDAIVGSGAPITDVEINGQRPDGSNVDRVWITHWYPLRNQNGHWHQRGRGGSYGA